MGVNRNDTMTQVIIDVCDANTNQKYEKYIAMLLDQISGDGLPRQNMS